VGDQTPTPTDPHEAADQYIDAGDEILATVADQVHETVDEMLADEIRRCGNDDYRGVLQRTRVPELDDWLERKRGVCPEANWHWHRVRLAVYREAVRQTAGQLELGVCGGE
jgi:hypothetical protein